MLPSILSPVRAPHNLSAFFSRRIAQLPVPRLCLFLAALAACTKTNLKISQAYSSQDSSIFPQALTKQIPYTSILSHVIYLSCLMTPWRVLLRHWRLELRRDQYGHRQRLPTSQPCAPCCSPPSQPPPFREAVRELQVSRVQKRLKSAIQLRWHINYYHFQKEALRNVFIYPCASRSRYAVCDP